MTRPLAVSLLAGLSTGVVDALLALAGNPDPALWSYRLSYALGPLLVALGWAVPVGLLAGMAGGERAAAAAVVGVWLCSVVADAVRTREAWPTLVVIATGAGLGALAMARLALDAARGLGAWPVARRRAVWAAATLALLVALAATTPASVATFRAGTGPCAGRAAEPAGPSLLLITVDALRADVAREMTSYRRLAARGTAFEQHVTTSPWTLPSIASLLTGLPLAEHGAGRSLSSRSLVAKTPLRADVPTLAGVLGARGYATHAVVTNPFLTARYGIDAGFCSFENVTMTGEAVRGLGTTVPVRLVHAVAPDALPSDRADTVVAAAERWLAGHGDRPFFLWLHFLDPHAPYGDRDGASTSLVLDLMAFETSSDLEVPFRGVGRVRAGEYRPDAEERRQIEALYREDVAFTDAAIGHLLDALAARGLAERTAVVLTADHGEEFWDHGGLEHGRTLYEEVMRVPLVVAPPGGAPPAVRREQTSVEDVAPTLLGLLGQPRAGFRGADLMAGPAPERALALGGVLFGQEWNGIRTPELKYMRSEAGEERLYDLGEDPREQVNAVAAKPEAVAAARARLVANGSPPSGATSLPAALGALGDLDRHRRSAARGAAPRIAPSPCESAPMPKSRVSRRRSRSRSRASTWCTPASRDTSPPRYAAGTPACTCRIPGRRSRGQTGGGHRCTVEVHILKEVLARVVDRDSNPFGSSTDARRVCQPQSRSPETRGLP